MKKQSRFTLFQSNRPPALASVAVVSILTILTACSGGGGGSTSGGNGGTDGGDQGGGVDPNNPENILPEFVSGTTGTITENATATDYVAAAIDEDGDDDALTYLIVPNETSGADTTLFSIDGSTGELSFIEAPDFEAPADADTDNLYELTVSVRDAAGGVFAMDISIEVLDATSVAALNVAFPTPNANVGISDQEVASVSGYISGVNGGEVDFNEIGNLYLNNELVVFDPEDPSRWHAEAALDGRNTLLEFQLLNAAPDGGDVTMSQTVVSERIPTALGQLAYDENNDRVLAIDPNSNTIYAIDLSAESVETTGTHPIRSFYNVPFFTNLTDIVIDQANDRALVLDSGDIDALYAIDLSTNSLSTLSNNTNAGIFFSEPVAVALGDEDEAFVLDGDVVFRVNLDTGTRGVVSYTVSELSEGPEFENPTDIIYDANNNLLYVADESMGEIIEVDLDENGDREIISDEDDHGGGPALGRPVALYLDSNISNSRILIADRDQDVTALDLSTGYNTLVSGTAALNDFNDSDEGEGPEINGLGGIARNSNTGELLVSTTRGVLGIALESGDRSTFTGVGIGTNLGFPQGIAYDHATHRVFLVDEALGELIAVDLNSGERSIISDNSDDVPLVRPRGIALDTDNNRVLVVDNNSADNLLNPIGNTLVAVDLDTGTRTMISNNNAEGENFQRIYGIALDSVGNRAFVTDNEANTVLEVDLTNGVRDIVSSSENGTGPDFNAPTGIAYDSENNRLLVTNNGSNALIEVDLAEGDTYGDRATVSDDNTGDGTEFSTPIGIALDITNNRALVADTGLIYALFSVDLTTGNREIISDQTTGWSGPQLSQTPWVVFDELGQRAFVTDTTLDAVIVIDLATGDSAISSQ